MDTTQVPAGYKVTELGVLPEDWKVKSIGELVRFEGGGQPAKTVFSHSKKPGYVRLIQIRDYKTDNFAVYIPVALARKTCTKDDVMIGRYGPPVFQILGGIEGAYNVALIKTVHNTEISRDYWRVTVSQETLFRFIDGLSRRSSGQTGVDMVELKKYLIPLPPPAEQQVISAALGEMDALLAAQRARLAKQRAVKQGLLQGLLSGEKRLPGFVGEWEVKRLGDIAAIDVDNLTARTPPSYEFDYVSLEDVNAGVLNGTTRYKFSEAPSRARRRVQKGDVLIATVRPNLKSHLHINKAVKDMVCSTGFAVIRCYPQQASSQFIYSHFFGDVINQQIEALIGGSNYPAISNRDVKNLYIPLPSIDEQRAIADVLTEADAHLAALEAEHAKTQLLKQGMMQNLLTGKIRLV